MIKIFNIDFDNRIYKYVEVDDIKETPFHEVERQIEVLEKELGVPKFDSKNPYDRFHRYDALLEKAANKAKSVFWQSKANLHPLLIGYEGKRIIVEYSDGEFETGFLSKSLGWFPCHLLAKDPYRFGQKINKEIIKVSEIRC